MISVCFSHESRIAIVSILSDTPITEADTGIILFGGYDKAKFVGELGALNIQPDSQTGQISSMTVAWTSLSITNPGGVSTSLLPPGSALPVILDTGATLTELPPVLYEQIAEAFNVVPDPSWDGGFIACEAKSAKFTFAFGFGGSGGPVISVPLAELVLPQRPGQTFRDGTPACRFGLAPVGEEEPILFGDTFIRSAYIVYDLDNQLIYLAPTNFNSDKTDIVEIGGKTVPSASTQASSVTAPQTATRLPPPGLPGSGNATKLSTAPVAATIGTISSVSTISGVGTTATKSQSPMSPAIGTTATKSQSPIPPSVGTTATKSQSTIPGTSTSTPPPFLGTAAALSITQSGIALTVALPLLSMLFGAGFIAFG